jgi:hypothetical protein
VHNIFVNNIVSFSTPTCFDVYTSSLGCILLRMLKLYIYIYIHRPIQKDKTPTVTQVVVAVKHRLKY